VAPLEFDPVLLTGHAEIDAQHRELFARAGALLEATREHRGHAEVVSLLDYLGRYVVEHFGAEEEVMARSAYDRLLEHRAEHQRCVKDFAALRAEFDAEGPSPRFLRRVNQRVTDWLREHIYRSDRALGEHLRKHGA
jgi:hemerythrin